MSPHLICLVVARPALVLLAPKARLDCANLEGVQVYKASSKAFG